MFCDLIGSVALSGTLDPEEFRVVLRRYVEAASAVARRFSGFVSQIHGDGMVVYFGYPKAREDSAVLAVRCGLGILGAIEELNGQFPLQLSVRIGIHTGLLVVGDLGAGERREPSVAVGQTPNVAARLQALAQPGTVIISADTWRLVRGSFHCESLGEHVIRGLAEPITVYHVTGNADAHSEWNASRDLTRLFGRDPELERLGRCWTEAAAGRASRAMITGEAGMGKSRMVREFTYSLAGQPHFCLIARGSAAAQNSAFEPLIEMLREQMAIQRTDTRGEQMAKIASYIESLRFPQKTADFLAAVFFPDESPPAATGNLSAAAARQRFIAWLPEFLRVLSRQCPVVFMVEDLHWIDPSTLESLEHLFTGVPLPRVFLLATARAEFAAPWLPPEVIALERLNARQVAEFAEAVGGGKEMPADILRQIVAKANGIPLFVEEMTKMVHETGVLVERETHFETREACPPMAIPDTLHELLMARLDATAKVREAAQIAAVLGQAFHYPMLRLLYPGDEPVLREQLAHLVQAGLLSQDGDIPAATFAFRHALIHAEAYQSLLRSKRRHYHERIAKMIAERFPETLRQQPELVAYHYTEAGRHAEAIGLWVTAATRSADRSANVEAIAQADQGLALLPALAAGDDRREQELALTIVRGRAAAILRGYADEEVERTYSRARELCRAGETHPEAYPVFGTLHAYHIARADFALAGEMADHMLRLGEATGMATIMDNAWLALGANAFYLGQFEEAERCLRRSLEIYESHGTVPASVTLDIKVAALGWLGLALLLCGKPDEGLASAREACNFANRTGHTHSVIFAMHFLQLVHYWREEPAELLAESEGFAGICHEQGFAYWLTLDAMFEGWAHVRLGRGQGMEMLAKGLAGWQRSGARLAGAQHFACVADAGLCIGATAAGFAAIAQAEEIARITGERCYTPHVAELKGLLLLRQTPPDPVAAEAAFRSAITVARELSASWQELRAATRLASLLRAQCRHNEARDVLDPCLRAVTGGSGTAPVREARALLADLRD
jgi:class 3 adenylate cyclase/tetratricopeptide (TPR) repeat protein